MTIIAAAINKLSEPKPEFEERDFSKMSPYCQRTFIQREQLDRIPVNKSVFKYPNPGESNWVTRAVENFQDITYSPVNGNLREHLMSANKQGNITDARLGQKSSVSGKGNYLSVHNHPFEKIIGENLGIIDNQAGYLTPSPEDVEAWISNKEVRFGAVTTKKGYSLMEISPTITDAQRKEITNYVKTHPDLDWKKLGDNFPGLIKTSYVRREAKEREYAPALQEAARRQELMRRFTNPGAAKCSIDPTKEWRKK